VTGGLGALQHMGNAMTPALKSEMGNVNTYLAKTPVTSTGGIADLSKQFDTAPYLSPHSDAVALLVLAHQTSVHNLIALTRAEAAKATAIGLDPLTLATRGAADRLLRAMLFEREPEYPGRVTGTSPFEQEFASEGPRDSKGRSLRDFDLERRLFRYPLSYLIYSDAFDSLPPPVLDYIGTRLRRVLDGEDQGPEFAHLTAADRTAIAEILKDTKPTLLD
jgi:hypothetical protein